MARIDIPDGPGEEIGRLFAMAPHMGAGIGALGAAIYGDVQWVPMAVREVARVRIAQINQCPI